MHTIPIVAGREEQDQQYVMYWAQQIARAQDVGVLKMFWRADMENKDHYSTVLLKPSGTSVTVDRSGITEIAYSPVYNTYLWQVSFEREKDPHDKRLTVKQKVGVGEQIVGVWAVYSSLKPTVGFAVKGWLDELPEVLALVEKRIELVTGEKGGH